MATTTRMRVSSSAQVYHRIAASGDMGAHDIGTTAANASGMGGSGDFEIIGGDDIEVETGHQDCNNSQSALAAGTNASNLVWVTLKHSGYDSSSKGTATTATLTIGVGGNFADGGFTLAPGESITLHGLGGSSDRLTDFNAQTSSGIVYLEIFFQDA